MTREVPLDPVEHMMVAAALARLGNTGAWDALLRGEDPPDPLDRADLELLEAVGLLARSPDGLRPTRPDPFWTNGSAMAHGLVARLRRALQHAEGGTGRWTAEDGELLLRQGRSSVLAADLLADRVIAPRPDLADRFEGEARFLDVGVGVAAIAIAMCRRYPLLRAVGLDVMPEVLDLAASEVASAGMEDRVELRLLSVADLDEEAGYDLAWLPQPFIPPPAFDAGLVAVLRALRPGGWLVAPVMSVPDDAPPLTRALTRHTAHVVGGGPVDLAVLLDRAREIGYDEVSAEPFNDQLMLLARRPEDRPRGGVDVTGGIP